MSKHRNFNSQRRGIGPSRPGYRRGWVVLVRANQRRLVLGLERFPKDLGGFDPSRGLIFLTFPLMLRRRFVEAPAARGSLLVSLRAVPRASPRVFLVRRKTLAPLSSGS